MFTFVIGFIIGFVIQFVLFNMTGYHIGMLFGIERWNFLGCWRI